MDILLSSAIFVGVFVVLLVIFTRGADDADRKHELLRRMAPSEGEGEDADITRKQLSEEGTLLKALYRLNIFRALERSMWQAGIYMLLSEMLLIILLMFVAGFALGKLFWGDTLIAAGAGVGTASLPIVYIRLRRKRRLAAFLQQLPYALDLMKTSLEAGHTLNRGLQVVVQEFADPLAGEFRNVVEQTRIGLPLPRALEELLKRMPVEDLRLLVVAVKVQSQVGSSLAQIIGRLSEIVRTRQRLRLQIRTLTAQARMSGIIVGLLPVVVLGVFSLMQPSYTGVLFHDPTGLKILKSAIVMDAAALFTIRRLLRLDY